MTDRYLLRRLALRVFSRVNPGDITINHQWCAGRVRLHSYRHKGYWLRGRTREATTMARFASLIHPGDTVIEIGGHIGYVTQYLASLVGEPGSVIVFEPGSNNLPYIRDNVSHLPQVELIEKACGDSPERRTFFLEDLTGQNNSFTLGYGLLREAEAKAIKARIRPVEVDVVTLDSVLDERGLTPQLLKIDVEGSELAVLRGSQTTIDRARPTIMAEVTEDAEEVFELLSAAGYVGFDPNLEHRLERAGDIHINAFWFHHDSLPPDAPRK